MSCLECADNTTDVSEQSPDELVNRFAERHRYERSIGHIVAPALVILNVLSLAANVVILVVLCRRGRRSRTAVIIINLGLNDIFLLCVGTPWKVVAYVTDSWDIGTPMCKLTVYSLMLTLHVEVYTLLLLASLRYVAIANPLKAAVLLTNARVYGLVCVVWVSAILINIPGATFAALAPLAVDNSTYIVCVRMPVRTTSTAEQIYGKCHFVLTYTVPLVVIFALLGASIRKLNTASSSYIIGGSVDTRRRKHAVYRLVALTVTYAVCVLPVNIVFLLRFVIGVGHIHSKEFVFVEFFAVFIAFGKCSIHPLLYNCMAEDFRKDALKLITRQNTRTDDETKKGSSEFDNLQNVQINLESRGMVISNVQRTHISGV